VKKILSVSSTWARSFGFVLMFSILGNIHGQGVVYVSPNPQPTYIPVVPQNTSVNIDINVDGTTDFVLTSLVNDTVVLTAEGSNQILTQNNYVGALLFGASIGSTTVGYSWSGGQSTLTVVLNLDGPNLSEAGNFGGLTNGFIGFDLVDNGANYYGWMQVQSPVDAGLFGTIVDWAYQNSPNTPIFAGEVPEPNTFTLLALSGIAVALLRRKYSK